jgi:hypothetical protein
MMSLRHISEAVPLALAELLRGQGDPRTKEADRARRAFVRWYEDTFGALPSARERDRVWLEAWWDEDELRSAENPDEGAA